MEYTNAEIREMAIDKVCSVNNEDCLEVFNQYFSYLNNVDFIYVDLQRGSDIISSVINMFDIKKGEVSSVFYSNKLMILNTDLFSKKAEGVFLNYDIGLDTQIVSYIERYINGCLDDVNIPVVLPLRINRTIASEINIDAYVSENCIISKEFDFKNRISIWSVFYFLNTPMMSEEEAKIKADDSTNQIIQFVKYARMANVYKERYDYIYCMLLKIVLLNFEKFKIREKLIELLRFQNEVTCTSDMGFVNIGLAYWEQGTKLRFFGKVQKGKKNILNILRNMAWDIFHWMQTALNFKADPQKSACINIPMFYSVDSRFLELSKIIKLKAVAVDKTTNVTYPKFELNRLDKFLSFEEQKVHLGAEALRKRNENRGYVDTEKIYKELEIELINKEIF